MVQGPCGRDRMVVGLTTIRIQSVSLNSIQYYNGFHDFRMNCGIVAIVCFFKILFGP
jgi:hypothetical protein